jgi:hypothetical protein
MARYLSDYFESVFGKGVWNIVKMEFEKTLIRCIFYKKKRYAGWKYTLGADGRMVRNAKPSLSGMVTERRDACRHVADGARRVIDTLLDASLSRDEAKERVRELIADRLVGELESGRVDWSQLIQSKQFRKRAADYDRTRVPIHIQLAERLERRYGAHAPETPRPGDRIDYVVVAGESRAQTNYAERGESPNYAWEQRLPLDTAYYVNNGVHATMQRVLAPILLPRRHARSDSAHKQELKRAYEGFLAERRVKRQRRVDDVRGGGLLAALARSYRCALCSCVSETPICAAHGAEELALHAARSAEVRATLDAERASLLATCNRCRASSAAPDIEESLEHANPCSSSTCDVYWRRRTNDRLFLSQ